MIKILNDTWKSELNTVTIKCISGIKIDKN